MTSGKPFRIRRQSNDGETLHLPDTNSCRACYRPLPDDDKRVAYCSDPCRDAHRRLTGVAA